MKHYTLIAFAVMAETIASLLNVGGLWTIWVHIYEASYIILMRPIAHSSANEGRKFSGRSLWLSILCSRFLLNSSWLVDFNGIGMYEYCLLNVREWFLLLLERDKMANATKANVKMFHFFATFHKRWLLEILFSQN